MAECNDELSDLLEAGKHAICAERQAKRASKSPTPTWPKSQSSQPIFAETGITELPRDYQNPVKFVFPGRLSRSHSGSAIIMETVICNCRQIHPRHY
jgi:hypothetical protein